jgi:hypothetical protein
MLLGLRAKIILHGGGVPKKNDLAHGWPETDQVNDVWFLFTPLKNCNDFAQKGIKRSAAQVIEILAAEFRFESFDTCQNP